MNIPDEVLYKILKYVNLHTKVKYIQNECNDGEQMRTIFIKKEYPYNIVNKFWNSYYKNSNKKGIYFKESCL